MLIAKRVAIFQLIINLLPSIYRRFKQLAKLDFSAYKATIKSYLRAVAWLTLVTWAPPHANCYICRMCGVSNWMTSIASLIVAS